MQTQLLFGLFLYGLLVILPMMEALECYNTEDKGMSYNGNYNIPEVQGFHCLNWNNVNSKWVKYRADNNYCRNPNNDTKPWCYTEKSTWEFRHCSLSTCDCRLSISDLYYKGSINITRNGLKCKLWSSTKYPSEESNYCRTPPNDRDNNGGPWCYVTEGWDRCNVPVCNGSICPTFTDKNVVTLDQKPMYRFGEAVILGCKPGYQLMGPNSLTCNQGGTWNDSEPTCKDIDECASNPCHNGGSCENRVNGYHCTCSPGYTGNNCDINIDECASSPCHNSGVCEDRVNGYHCLCSPGYDGTYCETDIDECSSNPCHNGGACVDRVNGYHCICSQAYQGNDCETGIDECASSPCYNGGTCVDRANGYQCTCYPGYTGNDCKTKVFCPNFTLPPHMIPPSQQSFKYQDKLVFECEKGYVIVGSSTATCLSNGTWMNSIPRCDPVPCPRFSIQNIKTANHKQRYYYQDTVTIECEDEYSLHGSAVLKCQINGSWSATLPSCERQFCSTNNLPPSVNVCPLKSKFVLKENVTFFCESGYIGTSVISTCDINNKWNPAPHKCSENAVPKESGVSTVVFAAALGSSYMLFVIILTVGIIYYRRKLDKKTSHYEDIKMHRGINMQRTTDDVYSELQ